MREDLWRRYASERTVRANVHPTYRDKVLAATEEDTVRTILLRAWLAACASPHPQNPFRRGMLSRENETHDSRPDEPIVGHTRIAGHEIPVLRFFGIPPNADATGDVESMDLLAGQSVGLVADTKPADKLSGK
jgi:nitronate monooxygenase